MLLFYCFQMIVVALATYDSELFVTFPGMVSRSQVTVVLKTFLISCCRADNACGGQYYSGPAISHAPSRGRRIVPDCPVVELC
jgi:hypothetical protein